MNLNSTVIDNDDDDDQHHHYFGRPLNPSSSSSVSCRIFFGSTQDHMGYYDDHHQVYQPQLRSDNNYDYNYGGSTYEIKNKAHDQSSSGLKLSLWKKEEEEDDDQYDDHDEKISNNIYPVKWMCSKMRVMQKMKKPDDDEDRTALNATTAKIEDDQYRNKTTTMHQSSIYNSSSSSMESSDHHLSSNLIRVCADCNTTKTPLWRSGPKGPKSLCNACGIRQRKARRAMAAAANGVAADQLPPAKIKVQRREKKVGRNGGHASNNSQLKKRCKTTPVADSPSSRNDLEDFMINLSKNLSYHRVFPEDEKDAAILLMALSSGLVHV